MLCAWACDPKIAASEPEDENGGADAERHSGRTMGETGNPATVEEYLDGLPEERKAALEAVRRVILENLPEGYEETIQYGMISYVVPHRLYPPGYHCDPKQPLTFASLGSQKHHMALYLMCAYGDGPTNEWFRAAYEASGKKLDMGKACVRFKKLDDLPLDVIGQVIARVPVEKYVERYEAMRRAPARKRG